VHLALSHCLAEVAVSRRPRGGSAAARSDRRARELVVSGDSDSRCGFLVRRRVSFNDSPAGKLRRERARPLEGSQPMPAPANESEQSFWGPRTQMAAIGVESMVSWPCGQDSHPKPGCHRRRDLRHEARSLGHWF
jgi:hypothetical protein